MYKKTEAEMERQRMIKIIRWSTRLKHSLEADEELNRILPDTIAEFDKALQSGELLTLPLGEAIKDVTG